MFLLLLLSLVFSLQYQTKA